MPGKSQSPGSQEPGCADAAPAAGKETVLGIHSRSPENAGPGQRRPETAETVQRIHGRFLHGLGNPSLHAGHALLSGTPGRLRNDPAGHRRGKRNAQTEQERQPGNPFLPDGPVRVQRRRIQCPEADPDLQR